jgi:hypothetical protein
VEPFLKNRSTSLREACRTERPSVREQNLLEKVVNFGSGTSPLLGQARSALKKPRSRWGFFCFMTEFFFQGLFPPIAVVSGSRDGSPWPSQVPPKGPKKPRVTPVSGASSYPPQAAPTNSPV